ncbi:zinc finger, c4 type (two domains) domain-containing protein [Ditylenchus destructor]|uniref:Zinc finger, c4 type (Two domains) domain-containing protein n=1 Tax=Ditylenchus destructor TaxID=166010 RepID=A0AAD4MKW6_9BILA|nr:zinc finger, c4 type (two domains) domain-containing protein [Ditylenchus destructor]
MNRATSSASTQCSVCHSQNHGTHFGVLACRACSSFFRRTIYENKIYKCRKNNNCDILKAGMRNACRACRLQHCLRAGMRAEYEKPDKVDNTGSNQSSPSAFVQRPVSDPLPFMNTVLQNNRFIPDLPLETPLLDHYRVGFQNFNSGQKSLFTIENPSTIFSAPQYKPVKEPEMKRMDRGSISLLHTMCINYFEPFNALPHNKKVEILKHYWKYFGILHRSYLTVIALPYFGKSDRDGTVSENGRKSNIDTLVTHYGYYVHMDTIRDFFAEEDDSEYEKLVRYCEPLMDEVFGFMYHYYLLNITEIELVAMLAIFFWNTVDKFGLLNMEMSQKRDTIFVELNSILLRTLGGVNGSARLGQIVSFMHKTMAQAVEMYESLTVAKIFLPQIRDVWDEETCPVPANNANGSHREEGIEQTRNL